MKRNAQTIIRWLIILSVVSAGMALAGDFELSRSTIDGGGVMRSTGGDFELSGTIGQPDAGAMAGGEYELTGGFWFPLVPDDCNSDGVVNLYDHGDFEACLTGSDAGVTEGCGCFDVNRSDAVDLLDFAVVQMTFTGS